MSRPEPGISSLCVSFSLFRSERVACTGTVIQCYTPADIPGRLPRTRSREEETHRLHRHEFSDTPTPTTRRFDRPLSSLNTTGWEIKGGEGKGHGRGGGGSSSLVAKEGCGRVEWPILQPWAVIRIEFSVAPTRSETRSG